MWHTVWVQLGQSRGQGTLGSETRAMRTTGRTARNSKNHSVKNYAILIKSGLEVK